MLKWLNSELNDILNIDSAIGINDHCHRISHTKIQNTNTSDIDGQLLVRFRPNGLSPSDKKTKTVITVSRSIGINPFYSYSFCSFSFSSFSISACDTIRCHCRCRTMPLDAVRNGHIQRVDAVHGVDGSDSR